MKKTCALLGGAALIACASSVSATPNKPINAAHTTSGTVCSVRANENDPYRIDDACEWKLVVKRDRDGTLVNYHYQDKGALQEGQTAPDRAVRIPV